MTAGTTVRLLGSQYASALRAQLFPQQSGLPIEVRSSKHLHVRFVFVDGQRGYLSGASFKDGGTKATIFSEIVDVLPSVKANCEGCGGKT